MSTIHRQPDQAAAERYDLVIVGGGVYGIMLSLEAVRLGVRPLLLERDDFGAHTSGASQRILHGGLRYLQQFDLRRHRESVGERAWFARHMPELVLPLQCLMPLYGDGLRHPGVFRVASWLNDRLSGRSRAIGPGRVLSASECLARFQGGRREGMLGAALWHDAVMTHPQRMMMELLRWSVAGGATALNYVEATGLIVEGGRVRGVRAIDKLTGNELSFDAGAVVNAAGPWSGSVAASFDRAHERLFRPSLAFTLLLDTPPLSDAALALEADRTYFLVPWRGKVLAGTYHAAWGAEVGDPVPSEEQIEAMLAGLRQCVPHWEIRRDQVMRCHAGLLPAKQPGSARTAARPTIVDHGRRGGPEGLVSVSGVKWTTARRVAERGLERLFPDRRAGEYPPRPALRDGLDLHDWRPCDPAAVRRLMEEEAVVHVDDLLRRRTDWGADTRCYESTKKSVETLIERDGAARMRTHVPRTL